MRLSASSCSPSKVRSCISFDAFCGSSQSLGSSARRFSSASRFSALSTSKRPPQQPERLLDFLDDFLGFGAHDSNLSLADFLSISRQKAKIHHAPGSSPFALKTAAASGVRSDFRKDAPASLSFEADAIAPAN